MPRIRLTAIERAARDNKLAMDVARAALVEHGELETTQAQTVLLAIRAGLVPGVKMEPAQPAPSNRGLA